MKYFIKRLSEAFESCHVLIGAKTCASGCNGSVRGGRGLDVRTTALAQSATKTTLKTVIAVPNLTEATGFITMAPTSM